LFAIPDDAARVVFSTANIALMTYRISVEKEALAWASRPSRAQ
jgi:hypothetical protein